MSRGSEWRRWDLHIHTPFTKKEDRYLGSTCEEKWDNFYSDILNYIGDGKILEHSICAIAITDYLSIENYYKVCNDRRLPSCIKLVLPNVELRIKPIAKDSPINIHCIFDPTIAEDLENRFFANLKFEYNHNQYSATRSEIIRLGRDFSRKNLSEDEAFIQGLEQYVISYETISNVFNCNPELREKTIVVVSNKSNDGVSGLRAHSDYFEGNISQLEATRRAIYQLSDMIFSSNTKDIRYFLGEGIDSPAIVQEKCGSLMPCIHGCDAHSNAKIFAPDDNKFCWIKADPTFEGLKQVLYEPKERVRISSTIPDSKPNYHIIDYVKIDGNSNFSSDPIYFSDKLTCIIGGKSTGKSLLIHNIAMAIDKQQVQKKQEIASTNIKQIPELKVFWRDGICSNDIDKQRKVIYIPQTYLNRLSDEEQETTEIDKIIQDIVLQDEKCLESYRIFCQKVSNKKQEIAKIIVDFLKIVSDKKDIHDACKEIGDEDAINLEIRKLTDKLEKLSQEYNVTEEEISIYQNAIEKAKQLENTINAILKEIINIQEIVSIVEVKSLLTGMISIYKGSIDESLAVIKKVADKIWFARKNKIIGIANAQIDLLRSDIKEQSEIINNLKPKIDGNEQVIKLSAAIVEEKEKLAKLTEYKNKFLTIQEMYNNKLNILSQTFLEFSNIYISYAESINKNFVSSTNDLEFSVKRVFRAEQFIQKIAEVLNNKSFGRFTTFDLRAITEEKLTPQNISIFIESLLINSNDSLQFKSNYTIESGLREILTDWYNIYYIVKMDSDSIQEMSPGKKALVLLRLLISLAESKCPILIDQPEDDLDNRSIFDELICFIKEKKIDRQIIIVTHNANIVLGGDAELVIVANQTGKNSPNRNYRFEYRSGAIEDNSPVYNEGCLIPGILNSKGIQEHICEILEGGKQAFVLRQHKYRFINN